MPPDCAIEMPAFVSQIASLVPFEIMPQSLSRVTIPLVVLFFLSGFTALLDQVVWQRLLGLFSGSDSRSVTLVVAAYLLGLGLGNLLGGVWGDRLSRRQAVQMYGFCNLGIAVFAICSRFFFYDVLFRQLSTAAMSTAFTLLIVFLSLLLPTTLMGVSLPLLAKALSLSAEQSAPRIGLLYGVNTLGSGVGTLIGGWYLVGTLGYEGTVYFSAALSVLIGFMALGLAPYETAPPVQGAKVPVPPAGHFVWEWCVLVFLAGFVAISLEIIWFRVLETIVQSIAYTYAHLLAFLLVSNALGSLVGAALVPTLQSPRRVFLWLQGGVATYALLSLWLLSLYWQAHPTDLRLDIGYIDPQQLDTTVLFKYVVVPLVLLVVPNFLLGCAVPFVQKAVQTDNQQIGRRVGLIQLATIVGNTAGSFCTGLVLLNVVGTAGTLRLLGLIGLGLVLLDRPRWTNVKSTGLLACVLMTTIVAFPNNAHLWAAFHGIPPQAFFRVAEDATGVAAVTEEKQQGTLLASGQAQASFPYLLVHALLGSLPALLHPQPTQILIIGLGSGGTAHTVGVNPLTQSVQVVELLGAELAVLREYAQTTLGQPLRFLFQDPRYTFVVGDGRRELALSQRKFDLIEADAIYPWRSRAGLLYSAEFFREVQAHLAVGGLFVEWNVGFGTEQTFRNVFPYVLTLSLSNDLYVLVGSDRPVDFNRQALLNKLKTSAVVNYLNQAGVDIAAIRQNVQTAGVSNYTQAKDGQPKAMNTDLFPRSEYYLNQSG